MNNLTYLNSLPPAQVTQIINNLKISDFQKQILRVRYGRPPTHAEELDELYERVRPYGPCFNGKLNIYPPPHNKAGPIWLHLFKTEKDAEMAFEIEEDPEMAFETEEDADMAPEVRKKRNITPVKSFSFSLSTDTGRFEISDGCKNYYNHPTEEFFDKFFDVLNFGGVLYNDDESD